MEDYRITAAATAKTCSPTANQVKEILARERAAQQSGEIVKSGLKVAVYAAGCAAVTVLTPALLQGVANGAVIAAAKLPSLIVPLLGGLMGASLLGAFATALVAAIGGLTGFRRNAAYASLLTSAAFDKLRHFLQASAIGSIALCGLVGVANWAYGQLEALGLNAASYGGSQVAFWLLGIAFALALVGLGIFAVLLNMKSMGNAGFLSRALLALLVLAMLPAIVVSAALVFVVGATMAMFVLVIAVTIAFLPIIIRIATVLLIAEHR